MLKKEILIILLSLVCAGFSFAQGAAKQQTGKQFKIELPLSATDGTPVPVKFPNLETDQYNLIEIPVITVPEDVENIALKKPVASSDDFPLVGELKQITDGDKTAPSYMEIMGDLQWVQIDLQKTSEIFAIMIWHYHVQFRAYKDVIVQLSDDVQFKKDVVTIFNNDHDNTSKMGIGKDKTWMESNKGKLIKLGKPLKARYVRFYSNGNTTNELNAYTEIEIYGR